MLWNWGEFCADALTANGIYFRGKRGTRPGSVIYMYDLFRMEFTSGSTNTATIFQWKTGQNSDDLSTGSNLFSALFHAVALFLDAHFRLLLLFGATILGVLSSLRNFHSVLLRLLFALLLFAFFATYYIRSNPTFL